MIEVKCPQCSYLQTFTEERFLTITDDVLKCPHCRYEFPRSSSNLRSEKTPEEVKNKIAAFSKRILNGGEIKTELAQALEALVRHYGGDSESFKAIGAAYTSLGVYTKAEEFLVRAGQNDYRDPDILHLLLTCLLAQAKFAEAAEIGEELVLNLAIRADDEDIAHLAMAYLRLGSVEKAKNILERHPHLNMRKSALKAVQKQIRKAEKRSLSGILNLSTRAPAALKWVTDRAPRRSTPKNPQTRATSSQSPQKPQATRPVVQPVFEYWVYAGDSAVPQWDDIRQHLAREYTNRAERSRMFTSLENAIQTNHLSIDYIHKENAPALFEYPEELIPQNAKGFSPQDTNKLLSAGMIMRVRYKPGIKSRLKGLYFVLNLVESLRSAKSGIVQDAVSHILWGAEKWQTYVADPERAFIESNVRMESLDEGETLWIHTHGLTKFGYPEIEVENAPKESSVVVHKIVARLVRFLVENMSEPLDLSGPVCVKNTKLCFTAELRSPDAEGHFPLGSMRIQPYLAEAEQMPETATASVAVKSAAPTTNKTEPTPRSRPSTDAPLKTRYLQAHTKALEELTIFKQSFERKGNSHEVHAVKAPFPSPEGEVEWMWVTLERWRGKTLFGYLENMPVVRRDLRKGSRVRINETDIYDWVIMKGGEVLHGAFTEKLTT